MAIVTSPLKVVLVDDHRMFREGVRSRLELEPDIQVIGEAASGQAALELLEQVQPAIVVLDIRLPDMSGIELGKIIRARWPQLRILVLTGYDFDQYVRAMARVGIQGYLLKDAPQEDLINALREVAAGGAALPPRIASKVMEGYASAAAESAAEQHSNPALLGQLTVREIEILELMHQGLRNSDIGEQLGISPRTVEVHIGSINSKLGAKSRTEAVKLALEKRLLK